MPRPYLTGRSSRRSPQPSTPRVLKGDVDAAKGHIVGPDTCEDWVEPADVARCKEELASADKKLEQAMPKLTAIAKAIDPPAGYFLVGLPEPSGKPAKAYFASALSKDDPCNRMPGAGYLVMWVKGRARVFVEAIAPKPASAGKP